MENNVLIFSDIHINDYANYNKFRESRLFQTRVLADLLIDAGKKYNCDRFIIAGDVTELPVMKNNVLNEVQSLLNKLCYTYYTKENFIIYGQHDLSTKDGEQDPRFSGLTAILPSNLYYADKKQWTLCGRSVAMMNWKPVQDLSWINGTVDLFVGHVTLAPPGAQFKGQDIDKSKFKLSITGDIHKHFHVGKMVSIGSCQQNKLGDQKESTAIVWNPNDNSWECINLDPDRKLLRLEYTNDRKSEGFNESDNTYKVYRPAKLSIADNNIINIPKWSEISDLVDNVIKDNGLEVIHNEVLKNCPNDEYVDFKFIPVKLKLENFRSIEYAEIYFDDMDKITISGDNGAGKSSIILGLYNALRENRSLKDFIRFGADSCSCEIEFIYQGVNNKILRGSKDYGCWINGEKLPYNNKREFEDDMYKRFPFLNYTDIYFFNADKSTVIGSMSPERKSEVISKLFRIDKIDSYNSTASRMSNDIRGSIESKISDLNNFMNVVNYLEDKISSTSLPSRSVDALNSLKNQMKSLQERYVRYNESKSSIDNLKGKIDSLKSQVAQVTANINSVDEFSLTNRLNELNVEYNNINEKLNDINRLNIDISHIKSDINRVNSQGTEVYTKLEKVKANICPTCGSKIVLKDLEDSLSVEMNRLLVERDRLNSNLSESVNELNNLNNMGINSLSLSRINSEINDINTQLAGLKNWKSQLISLNKSILNSTNELNDITEVEEVHLPDNFYDELNQINLDLSRHEEYTKLLNDLSFNKSKVDELNKELESSKNALRLMEKYIKLTGSTGDVYREVMSRISKDFSDDVIRYEVNQYKFRNKDHLDLDVQYNVAGRWVSYQSLSSGQKTMADINFLSRILVECGLLVFDETLKHLSQSSTEYCLDLMRGMNVHTMILTTHMYGTESFANKNITLNLTEKGLTKVDIR